MKKLVSLLLVLAMIMTCVSGAFAYDYNPIQNTEPTFETMAEARANGPAGIQNLEGNTDKKIISHPVLDGYPEEATYVYRSAGMFGGRSAARLNTNLIVFAEEHFADKDAAYAYLQGLGLIDIIDKAVGSVVLVTPSNPEGGFSADDQKYYYALQTAMLSQKASGVVDGETVYYSDAEYFGGYCYEYVIGIEGGATFINNYVAPVLDYISRIAGLLLIGGDMISYNKVAYSVPVWMVNGKDDVIAKYKAANETDAYIRSGDLKTYYNQAQPLCQVVVETEETVDTAAIISKVYNDMFVTALRAPVIVPGQNSAGTAYQGYSFDQAPYVLADRNVIEDGMTRDGICVTMYSSDRFSYVKNDAGEYLQTWVEYLPEEVKNNTAPAGSVPLILANHGGDDDPRLYVDENGWLDLIGRERIALVAPEEQYNWTILRNILPDFVEYILDTYPALDRSRVYVTGYSMGGFATLNAIYGNSRIFAAAAPQAGAGVIVPTEENEAQYNEIDLPIMICVSQFDLFFYVDTASGNITNLVQSDVTRFLRYNELPEVTFDFDKYPGTGIEGDVYREITLNGGHLNRTWYYLNDSGVPMVALNMTNDVVHALYPAYADLIWDFLKCYSRNVETGEVIYNPYVD